MKRTFAILISALMLMCAFSFNVFAETSEEENPLNKKCVLFVGDSITEASNEWGNGVVGWAGRIMKDNNMRGVNKGKSGASISTVRGANTVIAQLKGQAVNKDKFDYVIMHGGVNDAWDTAPVGVITEGFKGPFNQTTFAGGLEATFKYAKDTFTKAELGYIINFSLPSAKYGKLADMSEYFNIAKQICDKWGIDYLDLYSDEELNKNMLKTHTTEYLPDTIHPNTAGYDILSPVIGDWMKTIGQKGEESQAESVVSEESEESVAENISEEESNADSGSGDTVVYIICGAVTVIAIIAAVIILKKK